MPGGLGSGMAGCCLGVARSEQYKYVDYTVLLGVAEC
jgi:hypothetical protein